MSDHQLTQAALDVLEFSRQLIADSDQPNFDRVFLSAGQPVWDCEQLTAYVSRITNSKFGTQQDSNPVTRGGAVPTPLIVVSTVRAVAGPTTRGKPLDSDMSADALVHTNDGAILWYGLSTAAADGTLTDAISYTTVRLAQAVPQAIGNFAGWDITLELTL